MKRSVQKFLLAVAVLGLSSQNAFAFGKNKIVYDKFDWKIYQSTHFEIYFYEDERPSLQNVVNLAESAYDELSRKFNFQISKKVPLIFYATHSAFEQTNVELGFIPEGVGAFATPVRNRMVLPIDMSDRQLFALIKHELTHIFQYEILFQGRLGAELRVRPPTWIMEGMASFMAEDEDSRDRMYLRDAIINDNIPSITRDVTGYFAYRFGHGVFSFMLYQWGWDGVRDFIYEYRSSLGSSIARPLKRAFDITPEEFDTRFRTWLRKHYLPALIEKSEPTEYGEPFIVRTDVGSQDMSPVPAPSGDLLVALTTYKEDIDAVLMNVPKRELMRNLTGGLPEEYEYIVSQGLTIGPIAGRDLAVSPNGDDIAMFVKKGRGRSLMVVSAINGRIDRIVPMDLEQQLNPTYSPDGSKIAFHAFKANRSDIFTYDLGSGEITNLTDDGFYDIAPVYSPDGKWLYYTSVVDDTAKLFRLAVADPSKRYQITTGPSNDIDAWISNDGNRLYFASDRDTGRTQKPYLAHLDAGGKADMGAPGPAETEAEKKDEEDEDEGAAPGPKNFATFNIYSIDLTTGEMHQYTDVVGGCFTPVVFTAQGGKDRLVFASYYRSRFRLYSASVDKPLRMVETIALPEDPQTEGSRSTFLPPVEVAVDPENERKYGGFKLFVDDVQVNAGVTSDQTFVSRSYIFMSDMLGDRRFIASLDTVSTFANFDFIFLDLRKRLNWGVQVFDDRTYFVNQDIEGNLEQDLESRITAATGFVSYPFDISRRVSLGAGYYFRDYNAPVLLPGGNVEYVGYSDDFPLLSASFDGDSTLFREFGPVAGRRYQLRVDYAPDIDNGGTLTNDYRLDFRQYLQMTSRSLLAARVFAGYSHGNVHNYFYFGGLNTLRGYDFRTIVGDRAFYANFEIRFPLVDFIATPIMAFRDIRGLLFFDVGAAYFEGQEFDFWQDGALKDGLASLGWGFSVNIFGLECHWDFARRFDFNDIDNDTVTNFWIGQTF